MIIGLGTKNSRKVKSIKKILQEFLDEEFDVISYAANSRMPETPWDEQTLDGARNRSIDTRNHVTADYYVSIESGLIERYGQIYEEAWSCVITADGKEYFGYSSGLKVPDVITRKMKREHMEHSEVMAIIDKELGNDGTNDTWGRYSHNLIVRDVSLQEALRNALIQIFAPKESLYHKN